MRACTFLGPCPNRVLPSLKKNIGNAWRKLIITVIWNFLINQVNYMFIRSIFHLPFLFSNFLIICGNKKPWQATPPTPPQQENSTIKINPQTARIQKSHPKHSNINKMKSQRNTQQVNEQDKCPPNQTKQEEIGNLPDKEFRIMIVKLIQNLEIKME